METMELLDTGHVTSLCSAVLCCALWTIIKPGFPNDLYNAESKLGWAGLGWVST